MKKKMKGLKKKMKMKKLRMSSMLTICLKMSGILLYRVIPQYVCYDHSVTTLQYDLIRCLVDS